jgi:hypothetical protein
MKVILNMRKMICRKSARVIILDPADPVAGVEPECQGIKYRYY